VQIYIYGGGRGREREREKERERDVIHKNFRTGGMAQVVACLPRSSEFIPQYKKKRQFPMAHPLVPLIPAT
jgi:hypothetical protein